MGGVMKTELKTGTVNILKKNRSHFFYDIKLKFLFTILISFFTLSSWGHAEEVIFGRVVSVKDGDTIHVLQFNQKSPLLFKIRLAHIDAPEKSQPFGKQAKLVLSSLCANKNVRVDLIAQDRYGRYVGVVWDQSTNINLEMVKLGHAWWYFHYSKNQEYKSAEENAKKWKKGLWSMPDPMPPWIFRREKRKNAAST